MADGLRWEHHPVLREPLLVAAFEGWNDAGDAATGAADWLIRHCDQPSPEPFATIDSDAHVDYKARRPRIEVVDSVMIGLHWPLHACYATEWRDRHVVVVRGIEPNLRWRDFCDGVIEVARGTGCETIVTLGALLGDVPHSRSVRVTGTSNDPELDSSLGLVRTRYEGPTGIVGVLTDACRAADLRTVSLWAPVPHYVANPPNPPATQALLQRFSTVSGIALELGDLDALADEWRVQVDRLLVDNEEMQTYVAELERQLDAAAAEEQGTAPGPAIRPVIAEDDIPSGEELVGEVERFLREQGRDSS